MIDTKSILFLRVASDSIQPWFPDDYPSFDYLSELRYPNWPSGGSGRTFVQLRIRYRWCPQPGGYLLPQQRVIVDSRKTCKFLFIKESKANSESQVPKSDTLAMGGQQRGGGRHIQLCGKPIGKGIQRFFMEFIQGTIPRPTDHGVFSLVASWAVLQGMIRHSATKLNLFLAITHKSITLDCIIQLHSLI